jgi:hypothetical protein
MEQSVRELGRRSQVSAAPLAAVVTSLIENRNSQKANIECRIMNVEGRYSVYFIKKAEQSETILRHSAVSCSVQVKFHTRDRMSDERQ